MSQGSNQQPPVLKSTMLLTELWAWQKWEKNFFSEAMEVCRHYTGFELSISMPRDYGCHKKPNIIWAPVLAEVFCDD